MKKALLVVSFGTSYHDTREKNIAACERDLAASCPDRTLFRAFTSGRSSPSAGRSAPNLTPPFIASAGPMLW